MYKILPAPQIPGALSGWRSGKHTMKTDPQKEMNAPGRPPSRGHPAKQRRKDDARKHHDADGDGGDLLDPRERCRTSENPGNCAEQNIRCHPSAVIDEPVECKTPHSARANRESNNQRSAHSNTVQTTHETHQESRENIDHRSMTCSSP